MVELLEGEELTARLDRGPMSPEEPLLIAIQIASALEAARAVAFFSQSADQESAVTDVPIAEVPLVA